jgi:hypothetical protein
VSVTIDARFKEGKEPLIRWPQANIGQACELAKLLMSDEDCTGVQITWEKIL